MAFEMPTSLEAARGILRAAHFAALKHSDQRRKGANGEPYVNHLLEVAELVASALEEPDTNLLVAALLHDTVEDTQTTREELVEQFGEDVASLVMEVTDDKNLPKQDRKRLQVENAPKKTTRAQVLKLADKVSNLNSIHHTPPMDWDDRRRVEYFEWARKVVDGLPAPNAKLKARFDRAYEEFLQSMGGK